MIGRIWFVFNFGSNFLIVLFFHLDPLILADDDYFQNLQRTDLSKSSTDQQTETSIKIESEEEELDFVDELDINEPPTVIDDDILYNDPLMLPALNSGFGDVNDILGDLELFLSVCILINNS